uniref:Uncharacterized protein n=1 Tax=Knipowitschia caucasica TaxID=637954 RepID=A0AAV2MJ77_KNICA
MRSASGLQQHTAFSPHLSSSPDHIIIIIIRIEASDMRHDEIVAVRVRGPSVSLKACIARGSLVGERRGSCAPVGGVLLSLWVWGLTLKTSASISELGAREMSSHMPRSLSEMHGWKQGRDYRI